MIDSKYRREDIGVVAVLADIAGLHVVRVLACRFYAMVTVDAGAADIDVIKIRRQPVCCRVAIVARVSAGDVCRVLAGRRNTIVAGDARSVHLCVIHGRNRCPFIGGVAVFTDIGGLQVCRILARSFQTVVTTDAIAVDI